MDALRLLSGDAQTFLDKVWASRIHVHHGNPQELVGLLALDDVDELLTSTALRTPALRLAKHGNVLPASSFTRSASLAGSPLTGLVDARKVLDLFEDGASVVLQGLHRYWAPLTRLVRDLELSLGHPCQANAYLTPPGSQGFDLHSDTHDVFVFQTHGSKRWEVHDDSGPREVLLEPGVCMYLPTGTPHAAQALETASLHVTVGINQVTWRQVLGRIVKDLLEEARYDGPLPAGYLDDPSELSAALAEQVERLSADLGGTDAARAAGEEITHFLGSRASLLRGGFHDRLALAAIDLDTPLARRRGTACVLDVGPDRVVVLLGDRSIQMPPRLEDAIRFVRAQDRLRPRDLGRWLDDESAVVLTRRLVREGLLRVDG